MVLCAHIGRLLQVTEVYVVGVVKNKKKSERNGARSTRESHNYPLSDAKIYVRISQHEPQVTNVWSAKIH